MSPGNQLGEWTAPSAAERGQLLEESLIDIALIAVAPDGQIAEWPRAAERLFGYQTTEVAGRPWSLVLPEDDARGGQWLSRAAEEGGVHGECRLVRKDGTLFWAEVQLQALGQTDGFALLVRDETKVHHLEQRLHDTERRFRAIFDQALESILLLRPNGVVIDVNAPALEFMGLEPADLLGRPLWATRWLDLAPDARPAVKSAVLDAAAGKLVRDELVMPGGDGRQRTFDFSIKPIRFEEGIVLLIVEARDVTQQRRLEEQVRQALKMDAIGQLAGGIAHDFNNLLTVINGFCDLLLARQPSGPNCELLGEILKAGERAATLTRQLLAFSRRQLLKPQLLDLNAVIIDLEKMLTRIIGEDIDFATVLEAGLRPIKADRGQMEQVLLNLVVNARDAMSQGGKLTVATRNVKLDDSYAHVHPGVAPGRYVLMSVSDTGDGMTDEIKSHVFEPFFTTKEKGKGTGLGLATVFGIVKQSGGHIEVYSESGRGSTFKVYLPQASEGATSVKSLSGFLRPPRGTETILLVEDEEAVRTLGRHVLREWGYQVLEAGDGAAALEVARQHQGELHLLITDVVMPRLGGRQLAEKLREVHPEVRVLYVSGFTDDAVVRHGLLAAEMNFLQKPFSPVLLARKVREVLDATP